VSEGDGIAFILQARFCLDRGSCTSARKGSLKECEDLQLDRVGYTL